jgi:hypothetical protein
MTLAFAEAVYQTVARDAGLSASECAVLAMLALMADEEGGCWPKQQTVADRTRLHVDTVKTVLRSLHAKGVIGKEKRLRDDGSETSSMIVMLFAAADLRGEKSGVSPPWEGRIAPPSPGAYDPGAPGVHDPPHESSLKSSEDSPPKSPKGDVPDSIRRIAVEIRAETPDRSRKRSSVDQVARALKRAVADGADPEHVRAALRAYYADADNARDDGRYAAGPHRMIQGDLWRDWTPDSLFDADGEPRPAGRAAASDSAPVPPGFIEHVWRTRLERWLQFRAWPDGCGSRPGFPGCEAPASILAEFADRL